MPRRRPGRQRRRRWCWERGRERIGWGLDAIVSKLSRPRAEMCMRHTERAVVDSGKVRKRELIWREVVVLISGGIGN